MLESCKHKSHCEQCGDELSLSKVAWTVHTGATACAAPEDARQQSTTAKQRPAFQWCRSRRPAIAIAAAAAAACM
jgi:hypothetical protein